jgi:hypothetical protein
LGTSRCFDLRRIDRERHDQGGSFGQLPAVVVVEGALGRAGGVREGERQRKSPVALRYDGGNLERLPSGRVEPLTEKALDPVDELGPPRTLGRRFPGHAHQRFGLFRLGTLLLCQATRCSE